MSLTDSTQLKLSGYFRYEVEMVWKIVRYLGQQGYGTKDLVILTPYLGQLRELKVALQKKGADPILSDLDSSDLVRAGLLSEPAAKLSRRPIRLATIGMKLSPPSACYGDVLTFC